ncbi:MAG: methylated-DNA--[protein]-cysteine S-methyltransferase [Desulfobacteraceae bacterium]|nr:methylated-DNA--[protein]-cysteine S-methyltransferase [Desulfobacteraceae bacterium]
MENQQQILHQLSDDYERVEKAIQFIETQQENQPSLSSIADAVHLSEFHFQKLFSRWVGISPKRFLQFITKEHAKKLLEKSENILEVTYDSGLSSPGRLHDLFINCEAMTPGEYKKRGEGLKIKYGFSFSPFGKCLVAFTHRGICNLKFVRENSESNLVAWLEKMWPGAALIKNNKKCHELAQNIFYFKNQQASAPLHLFVKGTNFQIKVWEALTQIPFGNTVTYQDIARHIGIPGANRAVGTAIGKNPIPFLIPCHRVIKKMGDFGNYGEGRTRKKALIGWESAVALKETA